MPFRGPKKAYASVKDLQRDVSPDQIAALVSALVEFQRAQIFFMLAVQIAALIALHNPTYMEATSWQQLWNNVGILYDLAFGGCLPVVFGLFILRLASEKSFYTLGVSVCCLTLSAVTWFLTAFKRPDPNKSITYDGPDLPACGGMLAPTKYCYDTDWWAFNSDASVKAVPMLAFCFVVQLWLILDQIDLFRIPASSGSPVKGNCFQWWRAKILQYSFWKTYERAVTERFHWLSSIKLDTGERVLKAINSVLLLATELAFVGLNAVLISDYAHILASNDYSQTLNLTDWSLGQVISVTIWVPVLLEYIWVAAGMLSARHFHERKGHADS